MIKLREKFVSGEGGFSYDPLQYEQLSRTDTVALYRRSRDHSGGRFQDFEVFRIKIAPKGKQVFKQIIADDTEIYPSAGSFGFSAWSYRNRKAAEARFEELIALSKINPIEISISPEETSGDNAPEEGHDATETPADALPTDGFTIAQYATRLNLPYPQAYIKLNEAIARGEIRKSHVERETGKKGRGTNIYVIVTN